MIDASTCLVGLIGRPVTGSLSPRMQNAAFAATGLNWAYVPLPVDGGGRRLQEAVRGLAAAGFAGANITAPYKQEILAVCDEVDDAVAESGSANTLTFREGHVLGTSTDAEVLSEIEPDPPTAVVVGAGGAARAFAYGLRRRGTEVHGYSRRSSWPPEAGDAAVLVHATPVVDEVLVEPRPGQTVIDLPYRSGGGPTALCAAAQAAGCRVIDGLEVLVRQGAASFQLWTGIAAPLEVMQAAVRPYASSA